MDEINSITKITECLEDFKPQWKYEVSFPIGIGGSLENKVYNKWLDTVCIYNVTYAWTNAAEAILFLDEETVFMFRLAFGNHAYRKILS